MPGPGGYWLHPGPDGGDRGVGHLGRPVGVGEALAEVDRAGLEGERRHLGEDGRAEPVEPPRRAWEVTHPDPSERRPRVFPFPDPGREWLGSRDGE